MVGTALYVSPEVQGSTKSAYNQVKKEALGGKGKIERERERERGKKEYEDHSTGGSVTSWDSRKHSFTQSVQFSHSVMSDYLQPHGLQHARLPCLSPAPWACSNSCLSSRWCSPAISSSVVPFFSCLQSFPASGSFPVSQFFASGGQSIGVSASASVFPMNTQDWFPLGWTGWISLLSKSVSCICWVPVPGRTRDAQRQRLKLALLLPRSLQSFCPSKEDLN